MKICKLAGCGGKYLAKEYCIKHYYRNRRYGNPYQTTIAPCEPNKGCSIPNCKRIHYGKTYCHKHYNNLIYYANPKHRKRHVETSSLWKKNNPRTWFPDFRLTFHMNNVRKRDGNTCKWYGCNKTTEIHTHHIFPQSEYPELKYEEKYMICYCRNHHAYWHEMRGDMCYTFLAA